MLGKVLLGGLALCAVAGVGIGWWVARRVDGVQVPPLGELLGAARPDFSRAPATLVDPGRGDPDPSERRPAAPAPAAQGPAAPPPAAERAPADLPALIAALRDDAVRGNAMHALGELIAADDDAVGAELERALDSDDEQQRALAACALALRGGSDPSPALARELLALLTPAPGQRFRSITARPWIRSVGRANVDERRLAFDVLSGHPQLFAQVEVELEARLAGADPVLRFDAARIVLARPEARSRTAALDALLEHLADNDLDDDAALAMRLLGAQGRRALPNVHAALPGRDAQSASLLAHLLSYLDPRHPAAQRLRPKELVRLGFHTGDMLAELESGE